MQISIKVKGSKEMVAKLNKLGIRLKDMSFAMGEIGAEAARYYSNQGFLSQGGVFGNKWKTLDRIYALRKAQKYPGRSPLVATGKMRDSFTFTASKNSVLVGNKMDYFKYHQSTKKRSRMPRRPMMGINDPIRQIVRDMITKDIKKKIRAL